MAQVPVVLEAMLEAWATVVGKTLSRPLLVGMVEMESLGRVAELLAGAGADPETKDHPTGQAAVAAKAAMMDFPTLRVAGALTES